MIRCPASLPTDYVGLGTSGKNHDQGDEINGGKSAFRVCTDNLVSLDSRMDVQGMNGCENPGHDQIDVNQIAIEVPGQNHANSSVVVIGNQMAVAADPIPRQATERSFAQRHPFLARLIAISVAVLAAPLIWVANVFPGLVLMFFAAFSDRFATWIGDSRLGRCLWGDIADGMARNNESKLARGGWAALSIIGGGSGLGIAGTYDEVLAWLSSISLRAIPEDSAQSKKNAPLVGRNGIVKNLQENRDVLYQSGQVIGLMRSGHFENAAHQKENFLCDLDGQLFTGIAPSADGHEMCAYDNGLPLSVVPKSENIYLLQGMTGDCYALTIMYGLLKNETLNTTLSRNCKLNRDGSLTIDFPNTSALLKSISRGFALPQMEQKGYELSADSNKIRVDISRSKLEGILKFEQGKNKQGRAISNSLFVLAMEHFIGNLIKDDIEQVELNTSFEAHSNKRIWNHEDLVANLFSCSRKEVIRPSTKYGDKLDEVLIKYKKTNRCLNDIGKSGNPGFIKFGMVFDITEGPDSLHHAYALHHVNVENDDKVASVVLVNPHNTMKHETVTIEDLKNRQVTIQEFNYVPSNS
jgi:hypothetical protein